MTPILRADVLSWVMNETSIQPILIMTPSRVPENKKKLGKKDPLRGNYRGLANVIHARQLAMFLAYYLVYERSLTDTGEGFKRDRTTVRHAVEKIRHDLSTNPEYKKRRKAVNEWMKSNGAAGYII